MAWIPLESNPEVLNKMLRRTGVRNCWKFTDVYSLDDESLNFIQGPVISLIMLFPCDSKFVSNACGAVAVIHSLANNLQSNLLNEGDGDMKHFLEAAIPLNPDERGELLENSEVIAQQHNTSAHDGQTSTPSPETPTDYHYLSLVHVDGHLYELDGRKEFPINHGKSSSETFLSDAAQVCRQYMAFEPENLNFTVLALVYDNDNQQCQ